MTILLVQTFLLLLGAFLLGASFACLMRRGFAGSEDALVPVSPVATAVPGAAKTADTDRFGRALVGGQSSGVPPVFAGQPTVEVQPRPAPSQPLQRAEPAPQPAPPPPAPAPAPAPTPAPAQPPRAEVSKKPEPPPEGESYTQVAVAAAAVAAAAAAARAKEQAEAEAAEAVRVEAERVAEAQAQMAREEAEAAALAEAQRAAEEARLAEAARAAEADQAAAAAAAAVAQAQAAAPVLEQVPVPVDDGPSRFGTPVEGTGYSAVPGSYEPADDLMRIHGIDAETKERLTRYGIHQFAAIAAWMPDDVRGVSQSLGFQGRIERENWIEQAKILASGGDASRARGLAAPVDVVVPVNGDRLHRVIGIDPQFEALLYANGVSGLEDIAAWTAVDVERIEALLNTPGRVARESWIEQARFLTRGADAHDAGEEEAPADELAPGVAEPVVERAPIADIAAVEEPSTASESTVHSSARSESYTGLRSVRSEALIGESGYAPAFTAGSIDDLKRIRGIGVLIERKLNSLGVTAYEQVANWTGADVERISQVLDFKGRIERENWIEQARILASGGQTEFSRRADRGEV
jgi:predicted flap endonuclease-1-like 5' DNA nuclease